MVTECTATMDGGRFMLDCGADDGVVRVLPDVPRGCLKVGSRYQTTLSGWCEVVSVYYVEGAYGLQATVRFDDTGYERTNVRQSSLSTGFLRDPTADVGLVSQREYPVGSRFESRRYGWYEITMNAGCSDITIMWDNTKQTQQVKSSQIKAKSVKDKSVAPTIVVGTLEPKGYYVYQAMHNGEVVYIGKGKGNRYLHCTNGKSNAYGLNKLHFAGEEVVVSIIKDGMSEGDALYLEGELLVKNIPVYNTLIPFSTAGGVDESKTRKRLRPTVQDVDDERKRVLDEIVGLCDKSTKGGVLLAQIESFKEYHSCTDVEACKVFDISRSTLVRLRRQSKKPSSNA